MQAITKGGKQMRKEWNVTDSMGNSHKIECRVGGLGGSSVIVDNDRYKLKSSNWFIVVVDYQINLPGAVCNLVVIGNNIRLAVNGVFLEDGKPYEPVSNTPVWIWVLVAINCLGGWFLAGIPGMCVGILMSAFIIKSALEKKTGLVILFFVITMAIDLALMYLIFNTVQLIPTATR